MALTVQTFMRNSRSLMRVMNYLGAHLDDEIRLADLADLAELSRAQFLRLYADKTRETPIHTLRRLRLQRARAQIEAGRSGFVHVGADAGYGSNAAFTHAFVRQFGVAPSQLLRQTPAVATQSAMPPTGMRLRWMPMTSVVAMPYCGEQQHAWNAGAEINARVAVTGAKRWRYWHWMDLDNPLSCRPDLLIDSVCLVHVSEGHRINGRVEVPGLDHVVLPGGPHAVFRVAGQQRMPGADMIAMQIAPHARWQRDHGQRILYREVQVSAYRAPQDRLVEIWVPLCQR